jgi:hypothetical protein
LLQLRGQTVDTGGQDRLDRGWNSDAAERSGQAIGAARSRQHLDLDECPDAFLEKERVPLGAFDQKAVEEIGSRGWSRTSDFLINRRGPVTSRPSAFLRSSV